MSFSTIISIKMIGGGDHPGKKATYCYTTRYMISSIYIGWIGNQRLRHSGCVVPHAFSPSWRSWQRARWFPSHRTHSCHLFPLIYCNPRWSMKSILSRLISLALSTRNTLSVLSLSRRREKEKEEKHKGINSEGTKCLSLVWSWTPFSATLATNTLAVFITFFATQGDLALPTTAVGLGLVAASTPHRRMAAASPVAAPPVPAMLAPASPVAGVSRRIQVQRVQFYTHHGWTALTDELCSLPLEIDGVATGSARRHPATTDCSSTTFTIGNPAADKERPLPHSCTTGFRPDWHPRCVLWGAAPLHLRQYWYFFWSV